MSGGTFEYSQYQLKDIANRIEQEIYNSGRKKHPEELKQETWRGPDWYEKYPEDLYNRKYPKEVIEEFIKGYKILRLAEIYTQRIDWLIADDDGNESFLERLKNELELLDKELELKQEQLFNKKLNK